MKYRYIGCFRVSFDLKGLHDLRHYQIIELSHYRIKNANAYE